MASVGQFPARDLIRSWLKAGVVDRTHGSLCWGQHECTDDH
ncbi:hypothetical protein [Streptomyces sp. NPDC002785]